MEQEIPEELNRAEPEKGAKNGVTWPQGAVSGHNQALGTKDTVRKCTPNNPGGHLGMGEKLQMTFISLHFPTDFLVKLSTNDL